MLSVVFAGICLVVPASSAEPTTSVDAHPASRSPRFLLDWGSGGSGPSEFDFPIGIAINAADEVFVTDHYNHRVQKFDTDGRLLAVIPVLPNPGGIAIDADGRLYISHFGVSSRDRDKRPNRVTVSEPTGRLVCTWGNTGTGVGEFDMPGGLAVARAGRVYVADQTNRRVQVFSTEGKFLFQWGKYGVGPGEFGGDINPKSRIGGPQFLALDSEGNVYTTEGSVGRIQKFTADGRFLAAWGNNDDKPGSFGGKFDPIPQASIRGPIGICVDKDNHLWISAVCGRVQKFSADGKFLTGVGSSQGSDPGQFLAPHGVALDGRGNLYVVDAYNQRVQKLAVGE